MRRSTRSASKNEPAITESSAKKTKKSKNEKKEESPEKDEKI